MDSKLLTESGWKTVLQKLKVKDNGLQRALAAYEDLDEDKHEELLAAVALINQLATSLKKSKEVAGSTPAAKYLSDLVGVAEARHREVTKAKADAARARAAVKAKAATEQVEVKARQKPGGEDVDVDDDEEDVEEEAGEFKDKLMTCLHKLRSAQDEAYEFIVCDAKPHCGVAVAKRITPQHKAQLTKLTGSKHFTHVGRCQFKDGKFHFTTERPAAGLAHKLQHAIKAMTGKKLPIVSSGELADAEEQAPSVALELPKLPRPELATAPQVWLNTRAILRTNLQVLKTNIQARCASESEDFLDEVNDNLEQLDRIVEHLDHRLADSLAKASAAKDASARKSELAVSKAILAEYIKYVKSEPLIEHIDANPFGVKTNLKAVLAASLTHLAQSLG